MNTQPAFYVEYIGLVNGQRTTMGNGVVHAHSKDEARVKAADRAKNKLGVLAFKVFGLTDLEARRQAARLAGDWAQYRRIRTAEKTIDPRKWRTGSGRLI
jgi:hypothetical protein